MKSNIKIIFSIFIVAIILLNSFVFLPCTTVRASEESLTSITFGYMNTFHTYNSVLFFCDSTVMSADKMKELHDEVEDDYPNAEFLSSASYQYNCHSYAWYSQDTSTNNIWINDPTPFYADYSYVEVFAPQPGDIVCYYRGTSIQHSAIVESVGTGTSNGKCGNIDLMTVVSKWGDYALYRHNGYECPYTEYNTNPEETSLICDNVCYFRPAHGSNNQVGYTFPNGNTHVYGCNMCDYVKETHVATCTNIGLLSGHRFSCATCDVTEVGDHVWVDATSGYICTKCSLVTSSIPVIIGSIPADILALINERYGGMDEFMIRMDADTVLYFTDGQYYMVKSSAPDVELSDIRTAVDSELQTQ